MSRQTQNPEQVGEQGVCGGMAALSKLTNICSNPIDGEGCSCTLHRNYLFPITNNLEQEECEKAVGEVVVMNPLQCHM